MLKKEVFEWVTNGSKPLKSGKARLREAMWQCSSVEDASFDEK
jgi:hypothetical protein